MFTINRRIADKRVRFWFWSLVIAVLFFLILGFKTESDRVNKEREFKVEDVAKTLKFNPIRDSISEDIKALEFAKKEKFIIEYREELARVRAEEERIEKERLAKIEAERAEKERLAKVETERVAKVERQRLAKVEQDEKNKQESKNRSEIKKQEVASSNTDVAINKAPTRSGRRLGTFQATAYDLSVASCGKSKSHPQYGVTASGFNLAGHSHSSAMSIAADTRVIPMGSRVRLTFSGHNSKYNGIYTVRDKGGAIKGNRIDVFLGEGSNSKAMEFGRVSVEVEILAK